MGNDFKNWIWKRTCGGRKQWKKALRGKNEGHAQRTRDYVLKGIMAYWEKQEHRIQCQLKNNEGLIQTGMEQRMQAKKEDPADVGPGISSTMNCMAQLIQRDKLKMKFQTCVKGERSILNRIRRVRRDYWFVWRKCLDLVHVFNGLVRGEGWGERWGEWRQGMRKPRQLCFSLI